MSTTLQREQLIHAAENFGTPLYVYNAAKIKEQYETLTTAFKNLPATFFYASKALTNINILKYIKQIGCNIDCSSINEVKLALHAGFTPDRILYTSNGISFEEIKEAKELGVHINIDSLSNLQKFGAAFGHSYPVGIRLRPNIMAGGNLKISTGHSHSKFGIPVEQLEQIKTVVANYNLHIRHLHIHTGSEVKDVAVFLKGIQVIFDLVPSFPELEVIDLGGGFKVPYKEDEQGTDIQKLANELGKTLKEFQQKANKALQIWFEPGKFLVSEAGYFITQVNVLKDNGDMIFAGVNSGFNHLIRPMFYEAYHKIENLSNSTGDVKTYNITGNICETDNFAWNRPIAEIREGDFLVFYNAGAYGFEMASNYNSRFRPAEVLFINNEFRLIRERDTLERLLAGQIDIF